MSKPFSFAQHHAEKARRRAELDARLDDMAAKGIAFSTIKQECAVFPLGMLKDATMILPDPEAPL